jgi:hypothetical protein
MDRRLAMLAALGALGLLPALLPGGDGGAAAPLEATPAGAAKAPRAPFVRPLYRRRAVVWAVGDGADGGAGGRSVADLIESRRAHRFLYLGDVYETGTAAEYVANYRPLFGRFDPIAAPAIGNHEYGNRGVGFDPYWEAVRGRTPPHSYSFSVAGWQFLSLDSIGPVGEGSRQLAWLRRRLDGTPRFGSCRIAFTHVPRHSSGMHGEESGLEPVWEALEGRARLFVAGHDHHMERRRPVGGITELISGAGGHRLRDADEGDPGAAFVEDGRSGVLRLLLRRGWARASFVGTDGTVLDSKRVGCARSH